MTGVDVYKDADMPPWQYFWLSESVVVVGSALYDAIVSAADVASS